MKTVVVILFLAIGYLAIANASPVPNRTEVKTEDAATSRQAAPAAPAVTADDDDDDDDDDDIGDLGALEEDDDDDDEEPEDDDDEEEEEDYLERFIDDLLGGEDDDDDDDEKPSIVEPVQPASPAQTQATALPASVQSDLNAESAAATNLAAESINDPTSDATASYEDEDAAPEGQAVSSLEGAESAADPVILNQAAIPAPSQSIDTEDDDDEDDDDDIDLDLTEDDESDEEDGEYEEDDADEETDDLDEIADIADARRARAMEGEIAGDASAIYVAKYNRFVDNILGRINKILRANYDPVTVKLANTNGNTNKNKIKKKKLKNKSRVTSRDSNVAQSTTTSNLENHSTEATTRSEAVREQTSRASTTLVKDNKRRATATKNKKKTPTKTSNKNKVKQTKPKPKSKAKATLYGLSSLKRSGNVSVNMMSDHTTIRTKFNLGPLILKVEKEFGRAAKKELRSATATTAEMSGKLSLRVLHGGAATLHSIRVLQPKQVRVDSPDDHDRTREFVWRRSSHIAHLVSQKLSSATRSMLRPPPITTVVA